MDGGGHTNRLFRVLQEQRAHLLALVIHDPIGADARVGPFASLEPGAVVPAGTVTGPQFRAPDGLPGTG